MKFSNTFQLNKGTLVYPNTPQRSKADTSTLQSKRHLKLRYNLRTSFEGICLIYLASWFEPWQTDDLYRAIAQRCYMLNYQGEWSEVQRLLEEPINNPQDFYNCFIKKHSPAEFFGNVVKVSIRVEINLIYLDPEKPDRRKVRKPQRHRGYRDKGTYHYPHEKHGERPEPSEREDRRKLVRHILLEEESRGSIRSTEECVFHASPRKEVLSNDSELSRDSTICST